MPWFLIALFIASFILTAFFSPKPKIENARPSQLSDFNFPRSQEGDPVPRGYGTVKVKGPNTIGACDFKAVPIKKKVKTGLFSSKKQIIGYKYLIGLDMAVCLGPNVVFRRIWTGKYEIWNGCLYDESCENIVHIDLPELYGGKDKNGGVGGDIALYCGSFNQSRDSYLASKLDPAVPAYVGVAHAVFRAFWWGNSTNILPVYFEVACFPDSLHLDGHHVMANGLDANPVSILHDLYVNDWGNLHVDPDNINVEQWAAAAETIWTEGNGMSLLVSNANTGADLSKEILRQINAVLIENPATGLIDLRLIRQGYDIDTLPVLGPGEVVEVRNFTKKLWNETYNRVRVKYVDRSNSYADAIATAEDFANIRYQGRVRATDISMPGIYTGDLAGVVAARELANLNVPLYQCELVLSRKATGILPGDAFVFNWPEYGISQMVMRMRKTGLGTFQDGKITATVVQDEFALDAVVIAPPARPTGPVVDYLPGKITDYKVFELPYFLDYSAALGTVPGNTRLAAFAFPPAPASLNYDAFIDTPPDDTEVLESAPYSKSAKLSAALDRWNGFVSGVVASLLIKEVSDPTILTNSDPAGVSAGHGLFMLGDEILSYETFTDNMDATYTLTNVRRATLDTAFLAHAANDRLYFFDGQEGFFDDDTPPVSQDVYLIDHTSTGAGDKLSADLINVTPIGRVDAPLPPDDLTLGGVRALGLSVAAGDSLTVAWSERLRTATAIAAETDAAQAPEAGTTYDLYVKDAAGAILQTVAAITGATTTFTLDGALDPQLAVAEVWASRDGRASYSGAPFPFTIVSGDSLEIDADAVTVDGSTVEI